MLDIAPEAAPALPDVVAGTLPEVPVAPSEPLTLGFCVVDGLAVRPPGGTLVAGVGADEAEFGAGGDWVAPDCAKAGAAARIRAKALAYFNMTGVSILVASIENVTRPWMVVLRTIMEA